MTSNRTDEVDPPSEAGPSTTPQHEPVSQEVFASDESPLNTSPLLPQNPTTTDGNETVHSNQSSSDSWRHVCAPEHSHVHVEALSELLSSPHGSRVSLKLTINDKVIYLHGARIVFDKTVDVSHVLDMESGRIEYAFMTCPRCDGWSEWSASSRGGSRVGRVISTCSVCHGDGTIPNEEYFRLASLVRWSFRRKREPSTGQAQSATPKSRGSHSRRSIANPRAHRDIVADSTMDRSPPTIRVLPARGQRRACEPPGSTVLPAPSPARRITPTNIGSQSPEHVRARNEAVNRCRTAVQFYIRDNVDPKSTLEGSRYLEALEACISAYLDGTVPGALPGVNESSSNEVNIGYNVGGAARGAARRESPHHTDRYRRAVRDFGRQGLDDDFMRLSVLTPTPRRSASRYYGQR
ncbi:hypothetical protein H2200_007097 [Cladophialophora chaetospira]|uniref:Uncharacterized protein n=1 Tax=Cladophialophora chaetospira TaxID=386627 RepID=A0AA38X791_9EURO|nr:hypothetical protein H2200_007097 [Cladophialophora chaetospira]